MSLLLLTIHNVTKVIVQMVFYTLVKNYRAVNSLYPSFSTMSATELLTYEDALLFIGDFFYVSVDYRRWPLALVINLNCFHIKFVLVARGSLQSLPPWLYLCCFLHSLSDGVCVAVHKADDSLVVLCELVACTVALQYLQCLE